MNEDETTGAEENAVTTDAVVPTPIYDAQEDPENGVPVSDRVNPPAPQQTKMNTDSTPVADQ